MAVTALAIAATSWTADGAEANAMRAETVVAAAPVVGQLAARETAASADGKVTLIVTLDAPHAN